MNTSFLGNKRVKAVLISGAVIATAFLLFSLRDCSHIRKEATAETERDASNSLPAAERNVDFNLPVANKPWIVPRISMEFVWIKALDGWVGKYEVTNGEYRRFKKVHDSKTYRLRSLNGDRQPVVYVSYDDAVAFAEWLTKRERDAQRLPKSYTYRLPDGEEWMTFAQCGDNRKYPWGNDWPPKYGNYSGGTAGKAFLWTRFIKGYDDGFPVTCPVEKSSANDWGLYGVGGNVMEWTSTLIGDRPVARGACWRHYDPRHLKCTSVRPSPTSTRFVAYGFRLLLVPGVHMEDIPEAE